MHLSLFFTALLCTPLAAQVDVPFEGTPTALPSSGDDGSGGVTPVGSPDVHFTVSGASTSVVAIAGHPAWGSAPADTSWIGPPNGTSAGPPGTYVYSTTFDLGSVPPAEARLVGQWASDNASRISLNGAETRWLTNTYELTPFVVDDGFVAGINTLSFEVDNSTSFNPTGLLVADLKVGRRPVAEAPIAGLWSTGVDDHGQLLAKGSPETHWKQSGPVDGAVIASETHPWWAEAPAGSQWISPFDTVVSAPPGDYRYTASVDLTGRNPVSTFLVATVALDNLLSIFVNGVENELAHEPDLFDTYGVLITDGFHAGVNDIEFRVRNTTSPLNPTGIVIANFIGVGKAEPWSKIESGTPGTNGDVELAASGRLLAGTPLTLTTRDALPLTPSTLVVGFAEIAAPFKDGVLTPSPDLLLTFPTDADGEWLLTTLWPDFIPGGFSLWFQAWQPDAGGPAGFSATNALRADVP